LNRQHPEAGFMTYYLQAKKTANVRLAVIFERFELFLIMGAQWLLT
jgi:hypothetical protein